MDNQFEIYRDYFINQIKREKDNPLSYSRIYYWWKKTNIIKIWLKMILNEKGKDICLYDIGCGDAMRLSHILTDLKIRDTANYNGFDINPKSLQIAQLRFQYCEISHFVFEKANITQGIPRSDNSADVIISSEVLEHLQKPEDLFKEVFRLLKHDGIAIFTTPNERTLLNKFNKLFRRQVKMNEESFPKVEEEGFGHISVKSLRKWVSLAVEEGFITMEANYGSFLFGTPKLNNTPVFFAISLFIEKILSLLPKQFRTGEDALFMIRKP